MYPSRECCVWAEVKPTPLGKHQMELGRRATADPPPARVTKSQDTATSFTLEQVFLLSKVPPRGQEGDRNGTTLPWECCWSPGARDSTSLGGGFTLCCK